MGNPDWSEEKRNRYRAENARMYEDKRVTAIIDRMWDNEATSSDTTKSIAALGYDPEFAARHTKALSFSLTAHEIH